jgi:hypothetical protein
MVLFSVAGLPRPKSATFGLTVIQQRALRSSPGGVVTLCTLRHDCNRYLTFYSLSNGPVD